MQVNNPEHLYNKVLNRIEECVTIADVSEKYDTLIPFDVRNIGRNFGDFELYLFLVEQYHKTLLSLLKETITPYMAKKRVLAIRIIMYSC